MKLADTEIERLEAELEEETKKKQLFVHDLEGQLGDAMAYKSKWQAAVAEKDHMDSQVCTTVCPQTVCPQLFALNCLPSTV